MRRSVTICSAAPSLSPPRPRRGPSDRGPSLSRGRDLAAHFTRQQDLAVDLLRALVSVDSPTVDKEAVDRLGALVASEFESAGATVTRIPQKTAGDILRASFRPGREGRDERPVLLLAHLDTVWPRGEVERRPFRVHDGYATGPGVYDMKVGIVLCLLLARAARARAFEPRGEVICFLSSDEEIGSPASRQHVESEARNCRYVLGLEPSTPEGGAKTARKGVGRIVLKTVGVPAHAGIDPEKGVNAIEELAEQILAVKRLQDPATGTTIHAGVVAGGMAKNVVAPNARAEFDVRVPTPEEWARIESALRALRPRDSRARVEIEAALTHPPMVRTAAIASLFEKARAAAAEVGFELTEGGTGGASDGSFCAALGVPILDGLGVEGEGAHAIGERVRVDRIAPRAAFLALLLETIEGPAQTTG